MIKYLLISSNNVCMFHLPNRYVLCNNFPVPKYTYIHRFLLMASTRFRDDFARQEDQIRQSTQPLDYILNAPGNGLSPDYMEDPHIRLQKWGGNLATNSVTLESSLMGYRQPLNRDCLGKDEYTQPAVAPAPTTVQYPSNNSLYTEQPRAINPAWELRDMETTQHGDPTFFNPQDNLFQPFRTNVSTRILEKDHYSPNKMHEPLRTSALLPAHALKK